MESYEVTIESHYRVEAESEAQARYLADLADATETEPDAGIRFVGSRIVKAEMAK